MKTIIKRWEFQWDLCLDRVVNKILQVLAIGCGQELASDLVKELRISSSESDKL
jgi:hypothetical protein